MLIIKFQEIINLIEHLQEICKNFILALFKQIRSTAEVNGLSPQNEIKILEDMGILEWDAPDDNE